MKKGGGGTEKGEIPGPVEWGLEDGRVWLDGWLASVGKLLSVEFVEPLDKTSSLAPTSFSSFTLIFISFSTFTWLLFSFNLVEYMVSVSFGFSRRERGSPFL